MRDFLWRKTTKKILQPPLEPWSLGSIDISAGSGPPAITQHKANHWIQRILFEWFSSESFSDCSPSGESFGFPRCEDSPQAGVFQRWWRIWFFRCGDQHTAVSSMAILPELGRKSAYPENMRKVPQEKVDIWAKSVPYLTWVFSSGIMPASS